MKEVDISVQEFYSAAYMVLFGRERGPKLVSFVKTLDLETAKKKFNGTFYNFFTKFSRNKKKLQKVFSFIQVLYQASVI